MILSDFAFELGDEVEQETDQTEGGFGAIDGLPTKAILLLDDKYAVHAFDLTDRAYPIYLTSFRFRPSLGAATA